MGSVCGIALEITAGPSLHHSASTVFRRTLLIITAIYYMRALSQANDGLPIFVYELWSSCNLQHRTGACL